MSFSCDRCKVAQPPRTKPIIRVVSWKVTEQGKQIEKEEKLCPECSDDSPGGQLD